MISALALQHFFYNFSVVLPEGGAKMTYLLQELYNKILEKRCNVMTLNGFISLIGRLADLKKGLKFDYIVQWT